MASKGQNLKDRTGEKHITNEGYEVIITKYINGDNCTIEFKDGTIVESKSYWSIVNGKISNPMHKSLFGIGYIGLGKYIGAQYREIYNKWYCMFQRCYEKAYQNRNLSYKGVIVCEDWHNFQVFAKWYEENWKPWMDSSWQLDKDIICKDCKIYSPETCAFIPKEINSLFKVNNRKRKYPTGVTISKDKYRAVVSMYGKNKYFGYHSSPEEAFIAFKIAKEEYIKEVADLWKNKINPIIYKIMYNYQVEITD